MKRAVVTITIGKNYEEVSNLSHPTIKKYADKIGAEFVVINNLRTLPHWEKFQIFNLLKEYERIIYIDTDILVRDDCPDLFEIVPMDKLGIFNEGKYAPRQESLMEAIRSYNEPLKKDWNGTYYNTGVMVLSRFHKQLFKIPNEVHNAGMFEQPYLNLRIINDKIPVEELEYQFNRMIIMDVLTGEPRQASYMIHYAGAPTHYDMIRTMSEDLDRWEIDKPDYKYKKTIMFRVGGGLGDQVCAEPVIRYAKKNLYQEDNVIVTSYWPFLFRHLNVANFKDGEFPGSREPLKIIETLPEAEKSDVWKVLPPTLCHQVDFISISAFKKPIPDIDKQITLTPTFDGLNEISDLVGVNGCENAVLVNPGRGWASKTFPKEWWNSVINGLVEKGLKIIIIGKHISKEQGFVDVDVPEGVLDLRDQYSDDGLLVLLAQAKVLVSNDSAPVHLAGAFDNWIVLIPTCKHPDTVLPYRNGSKSYKTKSIYRKLTVDAITADVVIAHNKTLDSVIGDILDYLPLPETVVNEVVDICNI